jgi:hypothetical protein
MAEQVYNKNWKINEVYEAMIVNILTNEFK